MTATVSVSKILAPPTGRQLKVLRYVFERTRDNAIPPTVREIRDFMGFSGTNGVNDHLVALERRGLVARDNGKSRAIRITAEGFRVLGVRTEPLEVNAELVELRAEVARLKAILARVRGALNEGGGPDE